MEIEVLKKAFGIVLKQLREEKELSQSDLTNLADGLERTTYQKFDSGRGVPKVVSIIKIAEALGMDPGEILSRVYEQYKVLEKE